MAKNSSSPIESRCVLSNMCLYVIGKEIFIKYEKQQIVKGNMLSYPVAAVISLCIYGLFLYYVWFFVLT